MKTTLTKVTLAILCVAALGACGKKKGNSAVAAAPAGYTVCPANAINPYTQQYCQPGTQIYAGSSATTTTCTTGINPYTNQPCQIGTIIYGQQQIGYGSGYGYGYGYGQQNGCQMYQYQYGVPYYPQIINGQLMCVRAY